MNAHLEPTDFREFFHALHGYEPFPWQVRLAQQVCETGRMPAMLDLPTGTGKTACIEIAVFHLAYDLARGEKRVAPLRIAWVVDRRLIVDEAYDRAKSIADKIEEASSGILKTVADALRGIAGDDGPALVVQRLRGGMPLEGDWTRTPTQPTVISSTVDQVGSRLLFRGYGVSPRMRPVHAGLLGEDTLIVLDEVHLAEPFRQTLASVVERKRITHVPWQFVQLSATPRADAATEASFELGPEDWGNQVLVPRLSRSKPTTLLSLGRIVYGGEKHVARFADEALRRTAFTDPTGPKNVLVVVNRVALARGVYSAIKAALPEGHRDTVTLLLGRNRDVSKERIRKQILEKCKSDPTGKSWDNQRQPFIVVATQCIEAGADLDFDALITQIAPLDALRQRFGRLNRMGRPIAAEAIVIAVDAEIAASAKPDPIYDMAPRDTWRWLESKLGEASEIDFAVSALHVLPDEQAALSGPARRAPVLMPEHVRALSRTNPAPNWSPDVSLYLHGVQDTPAEVNVLWRADLPDSEDAVANVLAIVPPRRGEVISIPIGVARKWMRGNRDEGALADVDGSVDADEADHVNRGSRRGWRWRGRERVKEVGANEVRPGDTIVLHSAQGGCDEFGWNPSAESVVDVAYEAGLPYEHRSYAVRLHEKLLRQAVRAEGMTEASAWSAIVEKIDDAGDNARGLIESLLKVEILPVILRQSLKAFDRAKDRPKMVFAYSPDENTGRDGVILFAKRGLDATQDDHDGLEDSRESLAYESATEDDAIAAQGAGGDGESLALHSANVQTLAMAFANLLKLTQPLVEDIGLAAFLHDVGKADMRFQRYLAGDPWSVGETIRAKSGERRNRSEDRRAWSASRLPDNWRHEALSVRIARKHPEFANAHDPELVLWLIGTHHGFGRPVFPHQESRDDETVSYFGFAPHETRARALMLDAFPGPQRIDFELPILTESGPSSVDWQTMFQRLEERYGTWGLAWLESIVRLADHRASEASKSVPRKSEVPA